MEFWNESGQGWHSTKGEVGVKSWELDMMRWSLTGHVERCPGPFSQRNGRVEITRSVDMIAQ